MKRTLTINLNSIVFNIDDDAYEILRKYLSDIASYFSSDEEKEDIMADIEARIAELFEERLQRNKEVISAADVQEIIAIMGHPSQFSGNDDMEGDKSSAYYETEKKKKRPRRFYRDPENAILGGVCGGIAAQFNWDVTLVRVALVALTLFMSIFGAGWVFLLAYLLAWIIAPKAVTASQRLEMQGEDVTVENIKAEFENFKNYVDSENFKQTTKSVGNKIGNVVKWMIKIFAGIIGGILAFSGFIVVIVLFGLLISAIFVPIAFFDDIPGFLFEWGLITPEKGIMFVTGLLLVIACPVFFLIYSLIRLVSGRTSKSRTPFWVALVLWLAGVFMLINTTARSAMQWKNRSVQNIGLSRDNDENADQIRDISTFKAINISGNFKLEIEESPNQLLVVSAPEEFIQDIITEVKNETLFIHTSEVVLNKQIRISLSANNLESIIAKGATEITTNGGIKSENLSMALQGASQVSLNVSIENQFTLDLEGASQVNLQGKCDIFKIRALGASKIKAENLIARTADVYAADASTVKVYASESFTADASGAAKIDCYGKPEDIIKTERIGASIRVR